MPGRPKFVLPFALLAALPACGGGGGGSAPKAAGPAGYSVRTSQRSLPFANGFAAASYSLTDHKIDQFRDHVYATASPGVPSRDYCYDLYFGYRRDGASQWLTQALESSAGYVPGTGIVKVVQRAAGIRFETYWFAPMTMNAVAGAQPHAAVALVRAVNEGVDAQDCALFSLMNFQVGGEGDATQEWAFGVSGGAPYGPYVMEGKDGSGGQNRFIYKAIGAAPAHQSYAEAASAQNPFLRVLNGQHLADPAGAIDHRSDIAVGFEWSIAGGGTFAAGTEAWAGFMVAYSAGGPSAETPLKQLASDYATGKTPEDVLARELQFWQTWHAAEAPPAGLSADELATYRQSTAVLKMAQVREPGAPEGQILASLPPGQWNICWPRDAAYAIVALARTGHLAEAKKGLEFFLRGTADQYRAEVGRRYKISVCRYFGNGLEESDDNGNGPNVELDNFGLFLWALAEYVERSGDDPFLTANFAVLRDEVADVLVSCVAPNGLVKADSSIWERHLRPAPNSPDGKKQFAYTSINAANGLARASALATRAGEGAKAAAWRAAADGIAAAVAWQLTMSNGALAGSVEEKALGFDHAADAAVVEAVNHGVVRADSQTARATLAFLDQKLRAWPLRSPGLLRGDDARHYGPDNLYDRQEWVVVDLRAASALARTGRRADARALLDWVTAQAGANFGLIPELLDEVSSDYQGAVPMVGFGAGAYLLALEEAR